MNRIRRRRRSRRRPALPLLLLLPIPLLAPPSRGGAVAADVVDARRIRSRIAREQELLSYFVEGTRQPDCEMTMISFETGAARYIERGNDLVLKSTDHPPSMAMRTSHGAEANAEFRAVCDAAGGAWTQVTAAIYCVENRFRYAEGIDGEIVQVEIDDRMDETDVFIDHGRCFPKNDECDHYVRHPIDWEVDTQKLFGLNCTVQDSVGEAYATLTQGKEIPPFLLKYQGDFVDRSDRYDAAARSRRARCLEAVNSIFTNEKWEVYPTATELYRVAPVLIRREYFVGGGAGGMDRYKRYCRDVAEGARLDAWSGILDCVGVGPDHEGTRLTTVVENAAECFPPGEACGSYTAKTWTLDNMMEASFSCTVRGEAEGQLFNEEGEINVEDWEGGNDQDGKDDGKDEAKDAEDENGFWGGIASRGTDHLSSLLVLAVAGLAIVASAAFVSRRRRWNAVVYRAPEMEMI